MTVNASVSRVQASRDVERQKVYEDALALNEAVPGTVCITRDHYEKGRHQVPYRMGYVHGVRVIAECWHATLAQLERCRGR
jgi:hypothetical protein